MEPVGASEIETSYGNKFKIYFSFPELSFSQYKQLLNSLDNAGFDTQFSSTVIIYAAKIGQKHWSRPVGFIDLKTHLLASISEKLNEFAENYDVI